MPDIFDRLLVSCPNEAGGLFFIHGGAVRRIDPSQSTGLAVDGNRVLRGIQPATVVLAGDRQWVINADGAGVDDIHDVVFKGEFFYVVGTTENKVIKLDAEGQEVETWTFAEAHDSWHINCLADWNERIVFSAFGEFETTRGYKHATAGAGFVRDLVSGTKLIDGLSQPHSPVPCGENLIVANSEMKEIREYAPDGTLLRTAKFDGYTRGISVGDDIIYVGLSCSRNVSDTGLSTATVVAIDRATWAEISRIALPSREIYDVRQVVDRDSLLDVIGCIGEDVANRLTDVVRQQRLEFENIQREHEEQIERERDDHARRLDDEERTVERLNAQIATILTSRSWRVTEPLRKGRSLITQVKAASGEIGVPLQQRVRRAWRELRLHASLRDVRNSALFDADYYRTTYPDVSESGLDPATHFVVHGWKEHRNPSATFDTAFYLTENPDIANGNINPFLHYVRHGRQEGRRISASEPNVVSLIETDPETLKREIETIRLSGQFDEQFYVCVYPELQLKPEDSIRHYCEHGWRQGRDPSDDFDTQFYLSTYDDIRNAGMNPFLHYVLAGAAEGRQIANRVRGRREEDAWFGELDSDVKLIAFYALPDWDVVQSARPLFPHHSQPKKPDVSLGYYDLASADVLRNQARMATRHGVSAFCFELTTAPSFEGRKDPLALFLENEDIAIRFCVRVDVSAQAAENLSAIGDALVRLSSDPRCLRVDGRPLVVVEATQTSMQVSGYVPALRGWFREHGLDEPFIVGRSVLDDVNHTHIIELLSSGCNAALDFPAHPVSGETGNFRPSDRNGVQIVPYKAVCAAGIEKARNDSSLLQPVYSVVTLSRDNTAQQTDPRLVYTNFSTDSYRQWLNECVSASLKGHPEDRRFVFINAWNDWENGLYLEPDRQGGFNRLNETARALLKLDTGLHLPKVSIIVPNYNHELFLRQRLDSIYSQTYRNIEVILLDDCSPDGSREILDEYLAKYPDVTRVLYNAENSGGPFRQWARGLKEASGELVWIAESDDFCDQKFLEVLVRCFDDEAVLLAYGKSMFVNRDGAPVRDDFKAYVADLACAAKWESAYVETAHNEVQEALGIKNTIPNASGVLFKRPIELPLLEDEQWLSMRVAGDWVFYLHVLRGGKIAYNPDAINFFRRYEGSAAEATYKKDSFYREVGLASRTVAALYQVPLDVLERCRRGYEAFYWTRVGNTEAEFSDWYDYEAVLQARLERSPNVLVSTMGFYPGGAEILPIRLANEFKRQGLSVLLLSAGLGGREDGVRQMLRNDVPLIETSNIAKFKETIRKFHIEALNTHQWHIQKYPLVVPDVFDDLRAHVASLHGMIEHGEAFEVTKEQLAAADRNVTTWAYTADKNLDPFKKLGLYDGSSPRFQKIQNGMQPPEVVPVSRARMNIPETAFVLCCVSRAIPDKGWAEAIDAVDGARRLSGLDIRLILVGNGVVYDDYCKNPVPDFVYLAGFSEDSVGHYAAADMGIMLTKFKSESFPLTIVDCLFAGRPYIGTDVGEIRNMLTVEGELAGTVIGLDDWEVPVEQVAREIAEFASNRTKYLKALSFVPPAAARYRIDVAASQYIALFKQARDAEPIGSKKGEHPHLLNSHSVRGEG
ncbi:glycosyltransferase involved in cell wall biosynthesis [Neorhizobium galegae]|uniref:glycoside hydrolase family 99-like domain-containing protein n=1 Tax=Neorhizobium galegae TaxID=399 RepID=UPI001AE3F830|nr:glycoside hydrolase family 99-like domain-containing protein [Neorhizobium galegae]MBP2547681.1 glycosyltransferase involved in cell wall biosynthesis [Neorhizobium galegae]